MICLFAESWPIDIAGIFDPSTLNIWLHLKRALKLVRASTPFKSCTSHGGPANTVHRTISQIGPSSTVQI